MPKYVACPFYRYDKGCKLVCEDMTIVFRDREQLKKYLNERCGSIKGYQRCVLAQKTNDTYGED